MCLELTVSTTEWRQWLCSDVFIVNFSTDLAYSSGVSVGDFERVNADSVDEL